MSGKSYRNEFKESAVLLMATMRYRSTYELGVSEGFASAWKQLQVSNLWSSSVALNSQALVLDNEQLH